MISDPGYTDTLYRQSTHVRAAYAPVWRPPEKIARESRTIDWARLLVQVGALAALAGATRTLP